MRASAPRVAASSDGLQRYQGGRHERFLDREALWKLSKVENRRSCGRVAVSTAGVTVVATAGGVCHYRGVGTCGSVHACPVCAPKIRQHRTVQIQAALAVHRANGGTSVLMTVTIPHDQGDDLEALLAAVAGSWRYVNQGSEWVGRWRHGCSKERLPGGARKVWTCQLRAEACPAAWLEDGLRARAGVVGTIRSLEVTIGRNGWHPHLHVIVLVAGELEDGDDRELELQEHYFDAWCDGVARQRRADGSSYRRPTRAGFDWSIISDDEAASEYVCKPAYELGRSDLKKGKNGGRNQWELLRDVRRQLEGDDLEGSTDLHRWHEYEAATAGRRAIEPSRGLYGELAVAADDLGYRERAAVLRDERTDDDVAAEEIGGTVLLELDAPARKLVFGARGRAAALLAACEIGGRDGGIRQLQRWEQGRLRYHDDKARRVDKGRLGK